MSYQHLTVEKANHIATVTLDRNDNYNALSIDLMDELIHLCQELHRDTDTRVVIFTGAGKNFCIGADFKDPKGANERQQTLLEVQRTTARGRQLIRSINEINQITIAAVNGNALGGGACISAACDFRIGASDCNIGYPECNYAMNLQWGALPHCVHLVGPSRAKQLVILGNRENAETLLTWGFLDEIVEPELLIKTAVDMASQYAAQPPVAVQMIKRSVNQLVSALDSAIMHMDTDQFILATRTEDFNEGLAASFEKRTPDFKGN